jgi:DMSO/TMAO reductase YedYZ molybdopterin-dependent catalytic subunit
LGLPSPIDQGFEWLSRTLPGALITASIELLVRIIRALPVGPTAPAAKLAEHAIAVSSFFFLALVVGLLLGIARRPPRRAIPLGAAAGALLGVLVRLSMRGIGGEAVGPLAASAWSIGLLTAWGAATGASLDAVASAPQPMDRSRRHALRLLGAAALAITGVSLGVLRWLSRRVQPRSSPADRNALLARTQGSAASPAATALERRIEPAPNTRPELTATENFYRIDINLTPPRIDAERWRLAIDGLVDRPLSLSLDDLKARPSISQAITLECISNPVAGDLISSAVFTGVRLRDVLGDAGIQPASRAVHVQAADGFFESIAQQDIDDDRTLLVYAMNGEALTAEHGSPLRVYIPNRYGMKQPKWIMRIEAIEHERPGYWVSRGWDHDAIVKTTAVIDAITSASSEGSIQAGGIAFAGARGISRVEVQVDGGPWTEAALRVPPLGPLTWMQWSYAGPSTPGRHVLRVRAYDGRGRLQPTANAPPHPAGASGVHAREFAVRRLAATDHS